MKPPRLPSPFRNVRQAPRNFTFRSSHVDQRALQWKERKEAIEAEVLGHDPSGKPAQAAVPWWMGFPAERGHRLEALRRSRQRAMLRSAVIMAFCSMPPGAVCSGWKRPISPENS